MNNLFDAHGCVIDIHPEIAASAPSTSSQSQTPDTLTRQNLSTDRPNRQVIVRKSKTGKHYLPVLLGMIAYVASIATLSSASVTELRSRNVL